MTISTIPAAAWLKSTYSNADGNCVEVAVHPSAVSVRDSKDLTGPVLTFTPTEWQELLHSLRNDHSAWAEPEPKTVIVHPVFADLRDHRAQFAPPVR